MVSRFPYIFELIFLGNINENFAFEYEDGTTAMEGCGATLNGEFWYFGGWDSDKNVSTPILEFINYSIHALLSFRRSAKWLAVNLPGNRI